MNPASWREIVLILPENHLYPISIGLQAELEELDIIREWAGGFKLTAHGCAIRYDLVRGIKRSKE